MNSMIKHISFDKLDYIRSDSIVCLGRVLGSATLFSGVIHRQDLRMEGGLIKEGGRVVLVEGLDSFPFRGFQNESEIDTDDQLR
jgi:hypothetical protein